MLKKEAAFFGDIVILPFMDRYELVVLKTIAICEFGVSQILFLHILNLFVFKYLILFKSLLNLYSRLLCSAPC